MSLGALTTQFTPAPSCLFSTDIWVLRTTSTSVHEYIFFGRPLDTAEGCFPPGYDPASTAFYSPAVCPIGYSAATATIVVVAETTETAEVCCPTESAFGPQTTNHLNTYYPFLSTLLCEHLYSTKMPETVISSVVGGSVSKRLIYTVKDAINAYAVLVKRNNFDFANQTASSGSNTTLSLNTTSSISSLKGSSNSSEIFAQTGNTSSSSTPPSLPTGPNNPPPQRLSASTSIALSVSLGVLALALTIAIVYLFLKRRKNNLEIAAMLAAATDAQNKAHGNTLLSTRYCYELETLPTEMDESFARVEIATYSRPSELGGSLPRRPPPAAAELGGGETGGLVLKI